MENKKCCLYCNYRSDKGRCAKLNFDTYELPALNIYCDYFTPKKQKREVKMYAYICYDAAVGRLIWFDSQNYVDNRHDLFKRVPSEDKVVTVEI